MGCAQGHCKRGITAMPEAAAATTDSIWVSQPDGSRQCQKNSGISLEKAKLKLIEKGVKVLDSASKSDGKMRITQCKAATGQLNAFKISSFDLSKAEELGYKPEKPL